MTDTVESTETTTSISTTTITNPASIALYNRGPATAIFTPPASCLATLTSKSDMYIGHRTTGYFDPACYPASTTDRGLAGWDLYYYSPAQCPSGWASATRLVSSIGQGGTFLTIGSETTAVVCCPSNFHYFGAGHQCQSAFTSTSSTLIYITPTMNGNNQWTDTSLAAPRTLVATADPDYNVFNDGIPIFYQESDLAAFARATSSPSTSTPSRAASGTASPTSRASASSTSSTGLSTGAKIGIGIGIPLAVIALGIVGAFFWLRRRGMQRVNQMELQDTSTVTKAPTQYGGENHIISELYSDTPYDPHLPRVQYELPGGAAERR
ncbi:hypothetical protein BKA65DRAFT_556302 [Rhexocercosporidium sp. MPI-PUGE-AT-0058]|nr:hypothetical protein BKA65DRAFT_556302 [Rhexocercosporidium sp. MPI-PUGE-AT-0058]